MMCHYKGIDKMCLKKILIQHLFLEGGKYFCIPKQGWNERIFQHILSNIFEDLMQMNSFLLTYAL